MKITRAQLVKLIQEAVYFPPNISKDDIEFGSEFRKSLGPEERAKADAIVAADPTHLQGYLVGGVPEEKPDMPMKTFDIEQEQDLYSTPLNQGGGMKELVMNVDDEMYEYIIRNGSLSVVGEDEFYSLPLDSVYQEMRKYSIPKDLVDEVIEHYSYYGYDVHPIDMGGRKVQFIKVLADQ